MSNIKTEEWRERYKKWISGWVFMGREVAGTALDNELEKFISTLLQEAKKEGYKKGCIEGYRECYRDAIKLIK